MKTISAMKMAQIVQLAAHQLTEFGLLGWVDAPEPAFSLSYVLFTLNRLLRHLLPAA